MLESMHLPHIQLILPVFWLLEHLQRIATLSTNKCAVHPIWVLLDPTKNCWVFCCDSHPVVLTYQQSQGKTPKFLGEEIQEAPFVWRTTAFALALGLSIRHRWQRQAVSASPGKGRPRRNTVLAMPCPEWPPLDARSPGVTVDVIKGPTFQFLRRKNSRRVERCGNVLPGLGTRQEMRFHPHTNRQTIPKMVLSSKETTNVNYSEVLSTISNY